MNGELIRASGLAEALERKDQASIYLAGGTGIGYKDSGITAENLILIPDAEGIRCIETKDDIVKIGAMVTFTQALTDPGVPGYLKEALRFNGSLQKRNMATIGGNIAYWRSDSYLVPTLIAAGAVIELACRDKELSLPIREYAGCREEYADAIITAVCVKKEGSHGMRVLSKRFSNTVESHACLTIAMGREDDTYRIGIAIGGCGIFLPDIMNWSVSWKKAGVKDDMYGSKEYKRYLTGVTLDDMYEKLSGEGGALS